MYSSRKHYAKPGVEGTASNWYMQDRSGIWNVDRFMLQPVFNWTNTVDSSFDVLVSTLVYGNSVVSLIMVKNQKNCCLHLFTVHCLLHIHNSLHSDWLVLLYSVIVCMNNVRILAVRIFRTTFSIICDFQDTTNMYTWWKYFIFTKYLTWYIDSVKHLQFHSIMIAFLSTGKTENIFSQTVAAVNLF